jgi:ribose transport system substrate-binding protein
VARQIAQIQDLIQQDVDAMIIWPTNGQAVIPAVREAYQAEIPVIITNSNIAEDGFDFVTLVLRSRQHHARRALGRDHVRPVHRTGHSGRGPRVEITGQPGYTTAIERSEGFQERLPEVCPNVTLVDSQPGNWNREDSQQVMEAFLVQYDDIDGVYSGDDNMGVGALNAANAAGRTEGITFVGATNFAVGYDAMERGEYWGSIYQSPVDDAEAALQTALDVLAGEDVPFLNYFDTPKITQENMERVRPPGLLISLPGWGPASQGRPPSFRVSNQQD